MTDAPVMSFNQPDGGQSAASRHFRLSLQSVVARLLYTLAADAETSGIDDSYPFLAGYRAQLQAAEPEPLNAWERAQWWEASASAYAQETMGRLPLAALAHEGSLSRLALRVLLAAGLVEEDIRFGALFATLQDPLPARRPCIGLLGWLVGDPQGEIWPACRTLLEHGLVVAENRAEPRSEWVLRVPALLWDAIRGMSPADLHLPNLQWQSPEGFPALDDLILPETLHAQVENLPALMGSKSIGALVLRGMRGTGRRTVIGSVARALGQGILLADGAKPDDERWPLLGPLATLTHAIPVLRLDPGPGETLELPALRGYAGPVGITLGRSGGLGGPLVEQALTLMLPPPDPEARRRFWTRADVPFADGALDEVVEHFLLTGGHIQQAAALSLTYARLDGRQQVEGRDVQRSTRALNRQALETLATHLDAAQGWSDLVVGETVAQDLRALEQRCRERERLRDGAGPAFRRSLNRGVRAMLTGPSGTGKTLAARALAAELGLDLYRVDLAAVVNKYIGETERNLNQVLSRAEELDVLLLLDEGDALMSKRTEVRNANDRYANLETNYLLQRLETYEGIVVVTTNAGQRIDTAFLRRLDVIIPFAPPNVAERWLIWTLHLPADNRVSPACLEEVASRCALTGGQIRNAALHATLLALETGQPLGDAHLEEAVQREYRKAGAAFPMRLVSSNGDQMARLRRFVDQMS